MIERFRVKVLNIRIGLSFHASILMVMEHLLEFTQLVHIPCSLHFHSSKLEIGYIILRMDAKYFRQKSEFCFQLADGLSLKTVQADLN